MIRCKGAFSFAFGLSFCNFRKASICVKILVYLFMFLNIQTILRYIVEKMMLLDYSKIHDTLIMANESKLIISCVVDV